MIMVINNLLPVFTLLIIGSFLKRFGLTHDGFLKTSDRLIYFIFFPAMLFWKIGGAPSGSQVNWNFCFAVICALFCIYLLSCFCIKIFRITDYEAGSFSQSCYRFNTYIGMAIILTAMGEEGVAHFGILIGFMIPIINALSVSTLIWFSGKSYTFSERLRLTLTALISNPLIVACIAGILYAKFVQTFPVFIENTLRLMSLVALPMALISIGGALTFSTLRGYFRVSLVASVIKLILFSAVGYGFLRGFNVEGIQFSIGMIFFALPTSPAIYVLSSQLNSDTELASASIVLSTVLSFASLSLALYLFF